MAKGGTLGHFCRSQFQKGPEDNALGAASIEKINISIFPLPGFADITPFVITNLLAAGIGFFVDQTPFSLGFHD
jgi:hypothetical protein